MIPLRLFRNTVFTVSNSVGFIVGFAMFGAITFLPLYLQTVHGASPTSSGCSCSRWSAGCSSPSSSAGGW